MLFDTALGAAGIAWRGGAIVRCQLPEADPARTRARMLQGLDSAQEAVPEGIAAEAVAGVRALFAGERTSLAHLSLDWTDIPDLSRRVYELALAIPAGETRTYGDLARDLGDVSLSQAVGHALGRNPFAPIVPCHRILGADGRLGGFSGGEGAKTKLTLLNLERAATSAAPLLFDDLTLTAR